MRRRVRPQRDQIRLAGSGIEPAEFARRLRGEPEYALAIKGGSVEAGVAPPLGQREKLDGAGRGVHSGDCVLPPFGHPGGAVGPYDHAVGRRARAQCDQI